MVPYLRAANVKDGELDLADVKEMNFTPSEQALFSLRPGDVLVSEGSGSLATVGAAATYNGEVDGTVCFQNTLLRARPRSGTDARYLAWWCRHAFGSGLFASVATGANIYHLSAQRVRALPAALPYLQTQRKIADFLDREAARIDQIVAKKRNLRARIGERFVATLAALVSGSRKPESLQETGIIGIPMCPSDWDVVPLRRLQCEVQTGPFGSQLHADHYVVDGYPVVNPANLVDGGIVADLNITVDKPTRVRLARHILRKGDVVFGRRGQLGRAGLVTETEDGWLCGTGCLRVRFLKPTFQSSYLRHFLRLPMTGQYFESIAVGSTMDNLNTESLLAMRVLVPPNREQADIAEEADVREGEAQQLLSRIDTQVQLLNEHRRALVTAAVTGQLEVGK